MAGADVGGFRGTAQGAARAGGMAAASGAELVQAYGGGVYRASDAMQRRRCFDQRVRRLLRVRAGAACDDSQKRVGDGADPAAGSAGKPCDAVERPGAATPLRALWLENKSKLTLDSGSFSIFESGEFAGEGLLDPIHPGEKRLLSYAVDQAVRVRRSGLTTRGRCITLPCTTACW